MGLIIPESGLERASILQKRRENDLPDWVNALVTEMNAHSDNLRDQKIIPWSCLTIAEETSGQGLCDSIRSAEMAGIISPDQKVLDIGSGIGSALAIWYYLGYAATGIELNPVLAAYSKEFFARHKELFAGQDHRIIEGSYYIKKFLDDYLQERQKKHLSKAVRMEEKFLEGYGSIDGPFLFLKCDKDVYSENGISFTDFDIIYAYLWKFQMPSVIEMFKRYAKKDAKLFLHGPDIEEIPTDLGLKQHSKSYHVYTKR